MNTFKLIIKIARNKEKDAAVAVRNITPKLAKVNVLEGLPNKVIKAKLFEIINQYTKS